MTETYPYRVNLTLSQVNYERVKDQSKSLGLSMSATCHYIIAQYFEQQEQTRQAMAILDKIPLFIESIEKGKGKK